MHSWEVLVNSNIRFVIKYSFRLETSKDGGIFYCSTPVRWIGFGWPRCRQSPAVTFNLNVTGSCIQSHHLYHSLFSLFDQILSPLPLSTAHHSTEMQPWEPGRSAYIKILLTLP
jgi:hypothetical protein